MVQGLVANRNMPLAKLARERVRLRDAAEAKIDSYRKEQMKLAYDQMLFSEEAVELSTSPECVFEFPTDMYPVGIMYDGPYSFPRHYYRAVGTMNTEECECARVIDSLPQVEYWVRNLERRPDFSFWLQTSTDKFYPDFVALLKDGRILVVEYKRLDWLDLPDTIEKRDLGALWEARSEGRCIFRLVSVNDFETTLREVAG